MAAPSPTPAAAPTVTPVPTPAPIAPPTPTLAAASTASSAADWTLQLVELEWVGLATEVPAGWQRLEGTLAWTPPGPSGICLGVHGMALQPPMEAGPALLPQPAQVLDFQAVDGPWGQGRSPTLEVYTPAQVGDSSPTVESVEMHALFVVQRAGSRQAIDSFASAPDAAQLATLEPLLRHMVGSASLVGM
ncbi:MAG: hypothetical protein GX605_09705 [Chloroflexi bacterium]|nr:hypothetical protein [Chloroflexota bacterium]